MSYIVSIFDSKERNISSRSKYASNLALRCVYDIDHIYMYALQIENTSESGPRSYEAVAKKAQGKCLLKPFNFLIFFFGGGGGGAFLATALVVS